MSHCFVTLVTQLRKRCHCSGNDSLILTSISWRQRLGFCRPFTLLLTHLIRHCIWLYLHMVKGCDEENVCCFWGFGFTVVALVLAILWRSELLVSVADTNVEITSKLLEKQEHKRKSFRSLWRPLWTTTTPPGPPEPGPRPCCRGYFTPHRHIHSHTTDM